MSHYLTLMGVGRPVAYFPKLGVYLDSVTAGVFLCQMAYWHDKSNHELGVYKSSEEITEETGLTYREQATARKKLVGLGLIEETNRRLEHRIYFKFNPDVFDDWLSGCMGIEIGERRKRISTNDENEVRRATETQFVLQENTHKTTQEKIYSDEFEKFWAAYPKCKRKGSKSDASKTFKRYEKSAILILGVLEKFKGDQSFLKNNGEFIPSPSSWLNKKHWENEFWLDPVVGEISVTGSNEQRPKVRAIRKNYLGA